LSYKDDKTQYSKDESAHWNGVNYVLNMLASLKVISEDLDSSIDGHDLREYVKRVVKSND